MKKEDLFNNISKEVKEKLAECKTQDEMKQMHSTMFLPLIFDSSAFGFNPEPPQVLQKP